MRLASPLGESEIVVRAGCRDSVAASLATRSPNALRVAYLVDEHVATLWPEPTWPAGWVVERMLLPAGEAAKTRGVLAEAQDRLLELAREEVVVARGGGAALDLAGFAAATTRRGLPWIAMPTSVVAMADAAVGGKTAINHARGKNLLGAFHPPFAVLVDPDHLATLPPREATAGLAEIYKCARIQPGPLRALLSEGPPRDIGVWTNAIREAIVVKVAFVADDLFDRGHRRHLNYGHTIGHALERLTLATPLLHGEAVAIGMVVAATIGVGRGLLAPDQAARQAEDLRNLGLPTELPCDLDVDRLLVLVGADKKRAPGAAHVFVLPVDEDRVAVFTDISEPEIRSALGACTP